MDSHVSYPVVSRVPESASAAHLTITTYAIAIFSITLATRLTHPLRVL
jgi:hypothetical protein